MEYEYLSDRLTRLAETQSRIVPLKSMMLKYRLKTSKKDTYFIHAGDFVCVKDGKLVDCTDGNPTHRIDECRGTMINTNMSITLTDIKTNEPLTIKL